MHFIDAMWFENSDHDMIIGQSVWTSSLVPSDTESGTHGTGKIGL